MQPVLDQIPSVLQTHALKLLYALGILVAGWLVALIVYGLTRRFLEAIRLDAMLTKLVIAETPTRRIHFEKWVARGLFYLLMLFVFIAFFETLGLTLINDPLQGLLDRLVEYAPRLIAPLVLITFGLILASLLRALVVRLMGNRQLHSKMNEVLDLEPEFQRSITGTLANVIYWVVLLIFCLAVLDSLQMEGILNPLQEMMQKIVGFLPNVVAALMILAIGWFLARVVQRIVSNLLTTMGTDRLVEQVGLQQMLGRQSLAGFIGLVAYVIVLIPVLVASLNALQLNAITEPSILMLNKALTAFPQVLAAILVLFTAYLVGSVIARLVTNLLTGAGLNTVIARMGVGKDPTDFTQILARLGVGDKPAEGKKTISEIVGSLTLVCIMLFASIEALNLIGFATVADLLKQFTSFAGQVFLGLMIFSVGLFIANVVSQAIISSGTSHRRLLANLSRVSILVLSGAMALQQMGLAKDIITLAFGLILGAIALAFAIAFGIGGREVAGQILREVWNQLKTNRFDRPLP